MRLGSEQHLREWMVVAPTRPGQWARGKVVVEVTNVDEEPGTVTLSALQPAVASGVLTATLTDPDNVGPMTGEAPPPGSGSRSQSKIRGYTDIDKATQEHLTHPWTGT